MTVGARSQEASSERDRREALEALQVQLREARASLAREQSAVGEPPAVEALREAVARAELRLVEAKERRKALEKEAAALERERAWLEKELAEEEVLALGASRRDRHVEWATARNRDGSATSPAGAAASVILAGLLFTLALVGRACGWH